MEKNDQVEARLNKLEQLKEKRINPYPYTFNKEYSTAELIQRKDQLNDTDTEIMTAGRIVRYNRKGKMCFMHIKDQEGRIQIMYSRQGEEDPVFDVVKLLDIGDWVGITGTMFTTRAGEYSVKAQQVEMLSKAIRPLPVPKQKRNPDGTVTVFDEFKDVETRYRQRYIDLSLNDSVRQVFLQRSKIIQSIREYLLENQYMEVETPVLQPIYGGANARPFTTHHNAAGLELYLRVSNELYLKRCIVGGFERVFEFSKDFRNEGMDKTHNPEFTLLEFYQAYADYNHMMDHFEAIYEKACLDVHGTTKISYQGTEIDLQRPWRRLTVNQAIKEYAGIEIESMSDEDLRAYLKEKDYEVDGGFLRGKAILKIFEEQCEDQLIQPTFIIDFPKESTPLCKAHRDNPELVEQFEPYINGWEVGNAYSELNDPLLQRKALEDQVERGRGGEDETHPLDENFLHSIESGMPPTGGVGIGIDRMIMLLTDQPTIRDVLLFPLMKPEA